MVLPVNPEILWGHHLPPAPSTLPSSRTENAHSRSQDAPRVPFAGNTPSSNLRSHATPQKGLPPMLTSCDVRATPPSPGLPGLTQPYLAS